MKKKILLTILTICVLGLTACGVQNNSTTNVSKDASSVYSSEIESNSESSTDIILNDFSATDTSFEDNSSEDMSTKDIPEDVSIVEDTITENTPNYIAMAEEAIYDGDINKAYDYYGMAYWDGDSSVLDKLNELALNVDLSDYYLITKYSHICPKAGDNVKSVHIRLKDGTIIENGESIDSNMLDGAVVVMNDENLSDNDYYLVTLASSGEYFMAEDPEPNWAYDTVIVKNREVGFEFTQNLINENSIYDNLYVGYIDMEDYRNENYHNVTELNFNIVR